MLVCCVLSDLSNLPVVSKRNRSRADVRGPCHPSTMISGAWNVEAVQLTAGQIFRSLKP